MINVGIIGCGFVGGALKDWLEHNNPECKLFISDPAKGYHDDMKDIDIAFLQIHVRTEDCSQRKQVITYTTCQSSLPNALTSRTSKNRPWSSLEL